jgi:YjbE family integral membrane protein
MIEASSGALAALLQVLMIDLVLAGDNAVAVGLAAAGLPPDQRRKVIALGLAAAVVMRIAFALVTTQLLQVIGLLFGGGLLLLWVCWKMWRDLREAAGEARALAPAGVNGVRLAPPAPPKSFKAAFLTILLADLSMSLDNVLAVAGAAREHPAVLVAGLLVSVALMGLAASAIARLLNRHRWIGYAGLAIVLYVALHMVWEGHRTMVVDLGQTEAYNAVMPGPLDIRPDV